MSKGLEEETALNKICAGTPPYCMASLDRLRGSCRSLYGWSNSLAKSWQDMLPRFISGGLRISDYFRVDCPPSLPPVLWGYSGRISGQSVHIKCLRFRNPSARLKPLIAHRSSVFPPSSRSLFHPLSIFSFSPPRARELSQTPYLPYIVRLILSMWTPWMKAPWTKPTHCAKWFSELCGIKGGKSLNRFARPPLRSEFVGAVLLLRYSTLLPYQGKQRHLNMN